MPTWPDSSCGWGQKQIIQPNKGFMWMHADKVIKLIDHFIENSEMLGDKVQVYTLP